MGMIHAENVQVGRDTAGKPRSFLGVYGARGSGLLGNLLRPDESGTHRVKQGYIGMHRETFGDLQGH